jgi:hypothetical protein
MPTKMRVTNKAAKEVAKAAAMVARLHTVSPNRMRLRRLVASAMQPSGMAKPQ